MAALTATEGVRHLSTTFESHSSASQRPESRAVVDGEICRHARAARSSTGSIRSRLEQSASERTCRGELNVPAWSLPPLTRMQKSAPICDRIARSCLPVDSAGGVYALVGRRKWRSSEIRWQASWIEASETIAGNSSAMTRCERLRTR